MQQGGSQYGVSPEMTSSYTGTHMLDALQQQQLMQQQKPGETAVLAEAASPISSRPPARGNFDELGSVPGSFPEEDALVGDEGERGVSGNRWPRQETLALLKIRSEMDAVFRDATLKGPLWEDVSRKLAELGYKRSAKKCKEKFENVHKYYKRTKEGRAGRQDGKSYRFFSQLEALHSSSNAPTTAPASGFAAAAPIEVSNAMVVSSTTISQPTSVPAPAAVSIPINVSRMGPDLAVEPATGMSGSAAGISFSSDTSSSSSESEEAMEEGPSTSTRKRKRSGSGGGGSRKMTTFFEGLMRQVMEKQEAMQQRFLEAIERREQDRMIREEAWKRQEMARIAHEHDIMAQERAISASRDTAVIAFLQKITGQTIQIPQLVTISTAMPPPQPPPPPQTQPQPVPAPSPVPQQQQQKQQQQQPQPQPQQPQLQTQQQQQQPQNTEIVAHQPSCSDVIVAQQEHHEMVGSFDPVSSASSSRWPKSEVLALIKIRSGLESRYQEAGPKGPLWEEISAQMQQLGFNRSSKRCKEKWENINKYFKKVKESNKKRPEDAKTCPYFHQLDALYRKKIFSSSSGSSGAVIQRKQEQETNPNSNPNQNSQQRSDILAIMPPPPPPPSQPETDIKKSNDGNGGSTEAGNSSQVQTSTRSLAPSFQEEGPMKKPEDIVKELMEQQDQQTVVDNYDKLNGHNLEEQEEEDEEDDDDDYDDDYDDDEDEEKLAYKIQFQRQNPGPPSGGNPASAFLTMIQ